MMGTDLSGMAVRALRNHWGLTLDQLADLLNVEKAAVTRWEAGEMPQAGTKESVQLKALLLLDRRARFGDAEAADAILALRRETFGLETPWHPVFGETALSHKIPRNFAELMAGLIEVAESYPMASAAAKTVRKGALKGLETLKMAAEKLAEGADQLKHKIEKIEQVVVVEPIPVEKVEMAKSAPMVIEIEETRPTEEPAAPPA